jgi:hypothetical protein
MQLYGIDLNKRIYNKNWFILILLWLKEI